ncbi:phosphoribosylamine--glycine ligase [Campylobacter jejuni]|uniref:Phosphoribosylamine--glycine ligase n=2 Tax=Campylobacter jejuni TaxID=197 RepID=A0A5Y9AFT2_CAMJU|nr:MULTISPECIES: phosphoribosylamine--glycine ligase [Campylobacter]EDK22511.1 phosphoribosylamine--glycine ligase [Campylobacter jejuni subsp. jejuni CG8486]EFV11342.1 phosphoribosylamine-glycine ligase [Campylobacter jejuni subsp. jejuni 327]KQI61443.1 phosphoribosylamine--glycine ligase [Campylobacter jejuni CVM 41905]UBN61432.1 phosphoribosylamine--glycine ligase [Campylobacter coli]SQE24714.1 phosphoribosylamine--glycine ligase [Campylobacter jejuni subsp. doylei]
MKIMILGSGAREYSIALALRRVDKNLEFYFAPGNGATESLGTNLNLKDPVVLATYAKEKGFDLCIVGSESFLAEGVVDIFKQQGLAIFGPSKAAAMLETSKSFMKSFLKKYRIKTAKFLNTNDIEKAKNFIYSLTPPIVVKADGLCAGKGVIIAKTHEEAIEETAKMLSGESFGDAGKLVVIEEFLDGYELSIFAVCDGNDFVLLPAAQDHKKLLDNDQGPNTGGMGAYAPSSLANESLLRKVQKDIILPTLAGMKKEGAEFCGVLFIGAMIVGNKPYVLEFNVRFGDPECEVLMPLIEDPLELILAATQRRLRHAKIKIKKEFAVGVVCASENYPYKSSPKSEITVNNIPENSHISYAGVSLEDGKLMADGGRVLVCVGTGKSIEEAQKNAYKLCDNVNFKGKQYRKDIAHQVLK